MYKPYRHIRSASRFKQHGHANFLSDLMNTLGGRKSPQKTNNNPDPNNNNQNPDPNDPNDPNNKKKANDPNNPNPNPNNKSQDDPLDIFKDLFQNSDNGDDAPPSFSLDPTKLQNVAGQLNFAGQLSPEDLEGLKSGDAEKITGILNRVGQNSYMTLMQHLPALTDKYVSARVAHATKGLGGQVKQTLTKQALSKLATNNPVLKQQMDIIGQQLLSKFPDADPDWIAEQTSDYFVSMAKLIKPDAFRNENDPTPTPKDTRDISQKPDFNWGTYLTGQQPKK